MNIFKFWTKETSELTKPLVNGDNYLGGVLNNETEEGRYEEKDIKKYPGLLRVGDLYSFMEEHDKYYHLGRNNGQTYGSPLNLENGEKDIIARFQKIIFEMILSKEEKSSEIEMHIENFPPNDKDLRPKLNIVNSEIQKLSEQVELSNTSEGWCKANITAYKNGFMHGKKAFIDLNF